MILATICLARFDPYNSASGPDFRIEIEGRVVWIEAVAPTSGMDVDRISDCFIDPIAFIEREREKNFDWQPDAVEAPVGQTILRWTNAIRSKYLRATGYMQKGILRESDIYVIAVNSCNLGYGGLHGGEKYDPSSTVAFAK
jgi:hypothetical protein